MEKQRNQSPAHALYTTTSYFEAIIYIFLPSYQKDKNNTAVLMIQ